MANQIESKEVNIIIKADSKQAEKSAKDLEAVFYSIEQLTRNGKLASYWKNQEVLMKNVTKAYKEYTNEASIDNAKELLKTTNALKAISEGQLPKTLKGFEQIEKTIKGLKNIELDQMFSQQGFEKAFKAFDLMEKSGLEVNEILTRLGSDADTSRLQTIVTNLTSEVEKLTRRLINARNANEELRKEFENFKAGSGFADKLDELDRLKLDMQNIRNEAIQTFNQFLDANKIDRYDRFSDDRFAEYFEKLENGTLTATDAIRRFKSEYSYLLEESYKSSGDSFGLNRLQDFSTKLDSIFHQVEGTSNKINNILSNGVIAKSVQNLSEDTTLPDSQRSIFGNILQDEESLKSITALFQKIIDETNQTKNTEVFNTEQFTKIESLFTSIESSLSSIKGVLVDVGDGEELSPLLKTITKVESAINNLSSSVKNIGLNMNIDIGSDKEMEAKAQAKIANALQAYQRLFDHLKVTAPAGEIIGQKFFDFDISQYDTTRGKLEAYVKFIKDIRNEAKSYFNGQDVLYTGSDKKYWTQASSAAGQVTKVFNEIKAASNTNPLENLFGKTDLSPIISQLENIVIKLDEISISANKFVETFKSGLNISTSVKEVESLTARIKELEAELAKVKIAPVTSPIETNISLGDSKEQSTEIDLYHNLEKRKVTYDEIIDKIQTIVSLKEKEKSLSKTSDDTKLYQNLYDENDINWAGDTEGTINRISDRLKEIYTKYNGKISLIDENDIQEATYLLDILKGSGESPNLNKSQEKFYQNKKFSNDSLFDNIRVDSQKAEEIDKINTELSETYRWFNQLEGVSLNENIANEIKSLISDMQIGGKTASEYANDLLKIFNIEVGSNSAVEQQNKLQSELKETESQAEKTAQAVNESSSTTPKKDLKDAFQGSSTKAEASANAINKENEALKQTANTATEAATAKEKFTKANSKVKESADSSVGSVNQEAEALANAGKSAESGLNSIDEANRRIESLKKSFKDLENTNGFRKVNQEFEEAVNSITDSSSLKDYRNTIEQLRKLLSEAKKINTESNSALNRVNNQFENLSNSDVLKSTFSKQLAESSLIIDELNAKFKNGTISIDEYNTKTRQTLSNLAELKRLGNGQILGSVNSVTTIDAAKQQVLNYASQNSKKISKPINVSAPDSNGIRTITTEIITQENEIQKLTAKWSAATNTVSLSTKTMGTEVSATTKVIQGFVNKWKQLAQYMTAMYLNPYMLIYRIRDMITTVSELDYELMDLRKTADMSTSELHEFYLESNNVAKEMGVSTKEILSQASAWSRLGYNTKQTATEMAKLSSQFATISPGMEVDEATTGLVSVMKAFDITTDEVKSEIMDKINIVGNNFATNNQEIIEGLQRMASAMASTGADLEDTIALFTAGQEVVQDAEQVGSAIKSFSMRIRGMEETGEYLDELKDIKGDVYELTNGKVHIMEDENTYRPVLDILRDISEVWSEITDKNRAKLLEKLFAKTRANVGAAVLQNFEQAEKSLEVMENSAGSSDKEMSIAKDTLDYKINKLKETWTGFLQEIADQKTTGGVIDFFTAVSDVITNIVSGLGLLKTTVISVFAVIAAKNNLGRANYISSPSYCLNVSRV